MLGHRHRLYRRATTSEGGFTLIELLVVMLLISLVIGAVTLVPDGNSQRRELDQAARQLLATMQLSREEAVFQNMEIGLEIGEAGFSFRGYSEKEQKWVELPQAFMQPKPFPEWLEAEFKDAKSYFELKPPEQDEVRMFGDEEKDLFLPQILFLSSGEITPFTLTLRISGSVDVQTVLRTDGLAPIEIVSDTDEED
ncbi:type II secretion system minor pseudopilin GspH [Allohahella marinimesophila]|uniref:Type II secretion system protein H n=1 Tax=Allohahella marinimesophila TaxID=1054972 RepID=A0ABP7QB00_9GAMM